MKIAFLALSPRKDGGVYQYTLSAIEAFKILARQSGFHITFIHATDYSDCFIETDAQWTSVSLGKNNTRRDVFLAKYFGKGLSAVGERAFDLAISPKTCLAGYKTGRKVVVTLHDLQHKYFPQYFRQYRRLLRDFLYSRSVKLSDLTICNSNHVKQDIIKFYDVDPAKISVLTPPPPSYVLAARIDAGMTARIKEKYNLPGEYLFYPAQFWFHKNHIGLFKALNILRSTYGLDIPLVLVGSPREAFRVVMQEIHDLGLDSRVMYLGYVSNSEMPYLFKLSRAVVLPTLFESLCIPMWEAFSLDVPVVCSNVCGLPEQAGAAAIFFDPYDPRDIARSIQELLLESAKSRKLIHEGKQRMVNLNSENYANSWMELIRHIGN